MNYYTCIEISSDRECPLWFLRNALFMKFHKKIFELKTKDIGVSFPRIKERSLGHVLRIHSTQERLEQLQSLDWLGGLLGYCSITDILPVPDSIDGHQTISRVRQTMSELKLKQRVEYQKEQGVLSTDRDVKKYIKQYRDKMNATALNYPYLELQSTSTNNKYRLYVKSGNLQNKATIGEFNYFGFSKAATVPVF